MTPTFPLPLAASAFSSVIAEKFTVKEFTVIEGTFTGPEVPDVDDELLPQAARTRPAIAASEIVMLFLVTSSKKTTFCRQSPGRPRARPMSVSANAAAALGTSWRKALSWRSLNCATGVWFRKPSSRAFNSSRSWSRSRGSTGCCQNGHFGGSRPFALMRSRAEFCSSAMTARLASSSSSRQPGSRASVSLSVLLR